MRKVVFLLWFLTFSINIYAQVYSYDRYNNMMDTLWIFFALKIENDLTLEGFKLTDDFPIVGYGNSLLFEVFFTGKCKSSYILASSDSTRALTQKHLKQYRGFRIRKRAYFETFRRAIQENNKLPYDIIDFFTYKFITPYENSPSNHAIYGEYKFRLNDDEKYEIVEKEIEILQDRDVIMRKYRSDF